MKQDRLSNQISAARKRARRAREETTDEACLRLSRFSDARGLQWLFDQPWRAPRSGRGTAWSKIPILHPNSNNLMIWDTIMLPPMLRFFFGNFCFEGIMLDGGREGFFFHKKVTRCFTVRKIISYNFHPSFVFQSS